MIREDSFHRHVVYPSDSGEPHDFLVTSQMLQSLFNSRQPHSRRKDDESLKYSEEDEDEDSLRVY